METNDGVALYIAIGLPDRNLTNPTKSAKSHVVIRYDEF